jgi:hypothetical protein
MLSFVLNRSVLLWGRFVGILFVLMGLLTCTTPPINSPEPIQELLWWDNEKGEKHDDSQLLNKPVVLNQCVNEKGQPQKTKMKKSTKAGAWIHPSSIRKDPWDEVFKKTTKKPFTDSVAVSIVPYLEDKNGKKQPLFPIINSALFGKQGKFNSYYLSCQAVDIQKFKKLAEQHPHYYPTVLLTPVQKTGKQTILFDRLLEQINTFYELTTEPIAVDLSSFTTMGKLLQQILKKENIEQRLKQLVPFSVTVKAEGFGAASNIILAENNWILSPDPSKPPTERPGMDEKNDEKNEILQQRTSLLTKVVKITLPEDFVKMFENTANINLTDHLRLGINCRGATFTQDKNTFITNDCSASPTLLTIDGFRLTQNRKVEGNTTIFMPDNNILSKKITISQSGDYFAGNYFAYHNDNPLNVCDISGSSKSFPYQCIGKPLSFRIDKKFSRCDIEKTISLTHVVSNMLSSGKLPWNFSCKVKLTLPAGWNLQPSSPGCSRTLECKLSAENIRMALSETGSKKNKKDFQLSWGSGWETVSIPVDITKKTYPISAEYLIPRWPFAASDSWWKKNNQPQRSASPCTIEPRYAITSVIYSRGKNQKLGSVREGQLPTLISWTYAQLPDTVTLTLEQQGSQTAKSYRREVTISWKLSEVTAYPSWFLAQRGKSELEKDNRRLSLSTRSLNLDKNRSYGVYQFQTAETCRQSNDGSGGKKSTVAVQHEQQQLTVKPCEALHFKVIDELNGQPISRCTQSDKNWIAFKPYECPGKRKLIVVALGEKLNLYPNEIKDALTSAFQQYSGEPFTLNTIDPGRELSVDVFRCEDMPDSQNVGKIKRFINRKLTRILRFGARDLDAWRNLELIDTEYQSRLNELAGVFYVTDDAGGADVNHIYKYIGIPQKWKEAGVPLTVITTKSCKDWTGKGITCQLISQIGTALENFLRKK